LKHRGLVLVIELHATRGRYHDERRFRQYRERHVLINDRRGKEELQQLLESHSANGRIAEHARKVRIEHYEVEQRLVRVEQNDLGL
jgi:hypothetical protein